MKRKGNSSDVMRHARAMQGQTLPAFEAVYRMAGPVKSKPVNVKDAKKLLESLDQATLSALTFMANVINNRAHPLHDEYAPRFAEKIIDVCAPRRRIIQGDAENPFALKLLPDVFARPMPRDEKGRPMLTQEPTEYDAEIFASVRQVKEETVGAD